MRIIIINEKAIDLKSMGNDTDLKSLTLVLSAPAFKQSKDVFSKFAAFLPVKESLHPKVAKHTAVPAPIPDEAPNKELNDRLNECNS